MILKKLTVNNFGVFRGEHSFSLEPRGSRSIILFGGKNGAGKSTLFEAIQLCLYGSRAGRPGSRGTYEKLLNSRIYNNSELLIQPGFASLALELEYAESGMMRNYEITRSWNRQNGRRAPESLTVKCDGEALDDVAAEGWQDFVQDLIPSGISELFFFDGEKIQKLAEDEFDNQALDHAVTSLLGLGLVDRLHADLNIYLSRLTRARVGAGNGNQVEKLENDLQRVSAEVESKAAQLQTVLTDVDRIQRAIDSQEQKIAAEGGAFGRNREKLTKRQIELRTLLDRDEEVIRTFAADLLPFALVPKLCADLKTQLELEEQAENLRRGQQSLSKAKHFLHEQIQSETIFSDLSLPTAGRAEITKRFLKLVDGALDGDTHAVQSETVHDLSPADRIRLLEWIQAASGSLTSHARRTAEDLERNYRELHQIEKGLRKIPAEEVLKPLLDQLSNHHHELREASQKAASLEVELTALKEERLKLEREYSRELDRLASATAQISRIQVVPRVKSVLDDYRRVLVEKKVRELETHATECFNRLLRKKDALRKIRISPVDFSVALMDGRDHELQKNLLSAGEKQIYAVSMLWALARTSGRPLPMIVDTPLGRLDSDHRNLLIKEYFPKASHQMIVLSTDTEVDERYFNKLQTHVSHAYHLEFDPNEKCSQATSGYFWRTQNEAHKN